MSTTSTRRRRKAPEVTLPEPGLPPAPAGPVSPPQPEPASQPVPGAVTRTCSQCWTRQPLSALVPRADSYECADQAACEARAGASGLYPAAETELELAAREARQGALR